MKVITVWNDGTWKVWSATDAHYAENEPNWLVTIPLSEAGKCQHPDCDLPGLVPHHLHAGREEAQ